MDTRQKYIEIGVSTIRPSYDVDAHYIDILGTRVNIQIIVFKTYNKPSEYDKIITIE